MDNYTELFAKVKPHQKEEELRILLEFLERFKIDNAVEIGTGVGGTAVMFKQKIPSLVSIDISHIDEASQKAKEYGFTYVVADSKKQETKDSVLKLLGTEKIDFLFIDGSHTYEDVKKDYELWSPNASVIGFHDIVWNCGKTGMSTATVWKYWNELREEHKPDNVREIICSADGGLVEHSGIGVIWQ